MTTLADLMAEPDGVDFHTVRADFIRLEKTMNAKAYVDASFAWLAERSDAGRLVGSSRPIDFLITALGLSWQEATDRVGRGEGLFTTPVVAPMPTPEPEADESAEDRAARERLYARKSNVAGNRTRKPNAKPGTRPGKSPPRNRRSSGRNSAPSTSIPPPVVLCCRQKR
ncbi:hypothetical protein QP028_04735 [Corynebacterium suedekumii]|nr:hypothetical protein QP028_04735 [Corynebacterium suedekumii]